MLPGRVRSYAPRGQTPVLHVPLTRAHLSAISALTVEGRLLLRAQERAYCGADVVGFLRYLPRQLGAGLLVIWDGATIHHNQQVREFLATGGAPAIHLEVLPGYAPELNPQEGIWHHLKQVELKNVCCHDLPELHQELRKAVQRLRRKPTVIQGCITEAGY